MTNTFEGHLAVDVHDEQGKPISERITALLSENKPTLARQYRLKGRGDDVRGTIAPGAYTLQVVAPGYDVGRAFIEISAGKTTKHAFRLPKRAERPKPPVAERLREYGLEQRAKGLDKLHVQRERHVKLDYRTYDDKRHFELLRPNSVKDIRRWVGALDGVFPGDHPRFGPIEGILARDSSAAPKNPKALQAIANEFIYGNNAAVAQHVNLIDEQLSRLGAPITIAIFLFNDVVIEDDATLEIGNGSSVFFADQLTIHPRGTLLVTGDCRSDIGIYQQL